MQIQGFSQKKFLKSAEKLLANIGCKRTIYQTNKLIGLCNFQAIYYEKKPNFYFLLHQI